MSKSLEALKNRITTLRCNNRIGSRDIANQEILEIAMFLENHIVKDLERLEELKEVWAKEEWCEGIPLNAESLKSLFKYNEELFENNLKLDKENQELKEEYTLTLKKNNETLKTAINKINKLKNAITKELILLEERKETYWYSNSYDEYAIVNEIIEKLKEVLE